MLKIIQAKFQHPDVQAGFGKAGKPEVKLPTSVGSQKKQDDSRKTPTSASLTSKAFDCVDHNKLWKSIKEVGIPDHLTFLLQNMYAGQEATVRTGHGKPTGSKFGKAYLKAVYCHPAYLTYMQSTSCEMPGWKSVLNIHWKDCVQAETTILWPHDTKN